MAIEEHRLADGVGADKAGVVLGVLAGLKIGIGLPFVPLDLHLQILRAGIETAAAAHALGERIVLFLVGRADAWAGAHFVVTVGRNPGLHLRQRPEEAAPIDAQVADDWELRHRGQFDLARAILQQPIDQGRARLPHLAVDDHRACAADFLQAVAVPGDGSDALAVGRRSLGGDLLQDADDVHLRLVLEAVPLPIAGLAGSVLAEDANLERAGAGGGVSVVVIV
jgi:hypothetical protein